MQPVNHSAAATGNTDITSHEKPFPPSCPSWSNFCSAKSRKPRNLSKDVNHFLGFMFASMTCRNCLLCRNPLRRAPMRETLDDVKGHRDKEYRDDGRGKHAADDCRAHDLPSHC